MDGKSSETEKSIMRLPPEVESNSVYDIVYAFKSLLRLRESNSTKSVIQAQAILSKLRGIFGNDSTAQTFIYLCMHGAATSWILQCQLEMPEATVYRAFKQLRSLGFIKPAIKVKKAQGSRGGPRPTIWILDGSSNDDVADALRLHYRMLSPKYRIAEEVAQSILDEYLTPRHNTEITYREIIIHIKELKIPFNSPDIADLAANYLHERGIKVWR